VLKGEGRGLRRVQQVFYCFEIVGFLSSFGLVFLKKMVLLQRKFVQRFLKGGLMMGGTLRHLLCFVM